MPAEDSSDELVWAPLYYSPGTIVVIPRDDIERLQAESVCTGYLYDASWAEIAEGLDQLAEPARALATSYFEDALDNAWRDSGTELAERPQDRLPSDEEYPAPFSDDEWLYNRPHPENAECYSLPDEVRALGDIGLSLSGTNIGFPVERLGEIEAVTGGLGLKLVRDDAAITACCWPKPLGP